MEASSHSLARMSQSAPLTAPNFSPQKDGRELRLSTDRNFASHGKVMMLVLIISFTSFFLFLIIFLYAKRPSNLSIPKSDSASDPEVHPTVHFHGPLTSNCNGSRSGHELQQEPEKSGEDTHQTV
ncbi:hypothetical protein CDL15_Pgr007723 [Punica granatum]|uniref:Uncharacterized protein n=1 Tax=Punica granatum TaxID=22663 RepID=A0A218X8Z2_PUNGR|nr:hypothetical protein CDL15_Pgr007723 [Punica granatum]